MHGHLPAINPGLYKTGVLLANVMQIDYFCSFTRICVES